MKNCKIHNISNGIGIKVDNGSMGTYCDCLIENVKSKIKAPHKAKIISCN